MKNKKIIKKKEEDNKEIKLKIGNFIGYKVERGEHIYYGYGTIYSIIDDNVFLSEGGIISKKEVISRYNKLKKIN